MSLTEASLRLGFLGGSFDPVHNGHLVLAYDALEQAGLDKVYLVPASQAPLKGHRPLATAEQRLEMVRLATEGLPRLGVLDDELKRGGENYTYDTVLRLRERWPEAEFFWIIGADQVENLHRWYRIHELLEQITFLAVARPGYSLKLSADLPQDRVRLITGHIMEISSSEIRNRLATGKIVDLFLPMPVVDFISRHNPYPISV
jgi:nicotinate-nucleotide adenylyltransferase